MKKILNQLTFSNVYISLAAGLISAGISVLLKYHFAFEIGLFVFSSTLSVYSFQRLVKYKLEAKRESELNTWIENNQGIQLFYIGVSALLSIYLYFFVLNAFTETKWWMLFSVLLSVLYAVKINGVSLRDVPHLKMHLIAIVWCKALIFPFLLNNETQIDYLFFILGHYFFFIALCIQFDIRDIYYDSEKLKTLPQLVGVRKSKLISILTLCMYVLISIEFIPQLRVNPFFWFANLLVFFILLFSNESRKPFYYSLLVDGSILLIGTSYFL